MRVLVQRVSTAAVMVGAECVGEIGRGLLVFVGVQPEDSADTVEWLANKLLGLRIFAGDGKAMNRSLVDVQGELLIVSQFTLAADVAKGMRPSFTSAAAPEFAEALYTSLIEACQRIAPEMHIASGRFGADMQVTLTNDGPVTFVLDRP